MRAARVPNTDAKRHTPSQPATGNITTRSVCNNPIFPKVVNALVARIAKPVGAADTWPKPAAHHPEAYERINSPIDAVTGAIWPTATTPFRSRRRDPTKKTAARMPHNTYALRGVASRDLPADCAWA